MLHKFNVSALNDYSQQFAHKVCDDFFAHNSVASGQHILNLTAIPQVNLFIISSLYDKWKADAEAFKSPFFDFESSEVKEALKQFMNVVSRKISVKREQLEPVLVEATKDTLVLLIDPNSYFNEIFRNQPNFTVTADTIQQLRKYIRFNKFVPQSIAEAMADRAFVYVNQAIEWSEQAIAQRTAELDSIDQWVAVFSEKAALDASSLLKKTNRPEPIVIPGEPQADQSFFDTLVEESVANPVKLTEPEPPRPVDVYVPPVPAFTPPAMPPMPPTLHETVGGNGNAAKESLNERFRTEQASISSNYQKQPIASISQNIPLHQKFMFIHQLFGGSNSAYENAITELEQAPDFQTARGLITYKFASQHLWDMTGDTVGELLEIVKRRFGQ
ncbi:hypothetical protein [Runella aurantiaca]|uniref:Uncharacterized protein n=1 Tax=Runella aurantiaca TaxID=2282308 RepID=A0A369IF81_9BACT|nr:hypothetical protein [Runella aurantiaca]RDB06977.1 hypothetical protein DVG78_06795 [Runella aurantiaca]